MSWWKGEDSWDDCDLFNALSADAVALFFRTQARMARLRTDGVLTARDLDVLDQSRTAEERIAAPWTVLMAELTEREIFAAERDHWVDPRWLVRNPSREEGEARRAHDALRQRLRYAEGRRASPELKGTAPGLREEVEEARQRLNLAAERRRASAVTDQRLSRSLQTETTLHSENELEPRSAPSRPVPSPNKDEDEDTKTQSIATNRQLLRSPIPTIRRAAERALRQLIPLGSPPASPAISEAPHNANVADGRSHD